MTIQANPPLPDPTTGRMPQYTQVLQQNANGQWVIMYDVANVQTTSTTGTVQPTNPGLVTPIEEFPDPVPEDPIDPVPEDPVYTNPDIPPVFEGGGGRDNGTPTGPGIARSPFSGDFYDGETGKKLGPYSQKALSFALDSGLSVVAGLVNMNAVSHFASALSFDVQKSIMDAEKIAISSMDVNDRATT